MKITKEEIQRLRKLLKAGSDPPWEADIDDPNTKNRMWTGKFYIEGMDLDEGRGTWCTYGGYDSDAPDMTEAKRADNAELAAAAVTALPALLDALENQEAIDREQ